MARYITAAALIAIIIIIVVIVVVMSRGENAVLAQPTFRDSIKSKYRATLKDDKGMDLNDYALEKHLTSGVGISDNIEIY